MPPKGNQKRKRKHKQMEMPPKILHENTRNKTQNKKETPSTKNRKSGEVTF
jgi:hypothetical protein